MPCLARSRTLPATTALLVALMAACGGGSSAGAHTPAPEPAPAPQPDVTITLDPARTQAISPYVYGLNFYTQLTNPPPLPTFDRAGGNRWTAYNWENNASNAGSDYRYQNDDFLSPSSTPAEPVRAVIAANRALGAASLFTVPMQGWVAADKNGPVDTTQPPDRSRFVPVVFRKSSQSSTPFTATPPTSDGAVYVDEFVWALDQAFAGQGIFSAQAATPSFVQLDNEPELWNHTHLEIQGSRLVSSDDYIARTVALSQALKAQFPGLTIFGPAHYGFAGLYSWQQELAATPSGRDWFADKYLAALKRASDSAGRRLVDVYDFHWYSEARDPDGRRITELTGPTLSDAQVQAIVQSPRSLWDPDYAESSWIRDVLGGPLRLLPRLQDKIAAANPGMRLAITEYNNGGCQHIAGTLAQADNLGLFGALGLFAANYWPLNSDERHCLAAFRAFRGFDGASAVFGDTSVKASSSQVREVVAYASTDSRRPGRAVFVAINRSAAAKQVAFNGLAVAGTARLWRIDAASAAGQNPVQPVAAGTLAVSGTSFSVALPAYSVTTIEIP